VPLVLVGARRQDVRMVVDSADVLSPLAHAWFQRSFAAPTPAQTGAWQAIAAGDSVLVVAPTGSGKTLAAFYYALDQLMAQPRPEPGTRVLYVSPLKALAVDVERNLRAPLAGLRHEYSAAGVTAPDVAVAVRTGDTSAKERRSQLRHPADILITTPESLYLMLTSAARETLRTVDTVIVDEIHALAGTKRGAHLALSLERLDELLATPAQRIGLSATVRPTTTVARFLGSTRPVHIVDEPVTKELAIDVVVPVPDMTEIGDYTGELEGSAAGEQPRNSIWPYVEQDIADAVQGHTSTLVFVNSRRLAERLTAKLNELSALYAPELTSGDDPVPVIARAHHGSVSKEQRTQIEDELKAGHLPAVVATSSLELGIDMGAIDLVVQVEAPPTVAAGLQRIGRSGHQVGAVSRGRFYPKYRGDLLPTAVVAQAMRDRDIEAISILDNPLDVLTQQVIAMVAMDDWDERELFEVIRRAAPFGSLSDGVWHEVLDMASGKYASSGFNSLRPRLLWDRETGRLSARPGAQRLAVTSGGTIPDRGLFAVHLIGERAAKIGELDEEMVYESRVGDVFALGASSWRIEEITHDRVLVSAAPGQPGKVPFWHGDALGRGVHVGARIGEFLRHADADLAAGRTDFAELLSQWGLDGWASANLVAYLNDQRHAVGRLPSDRLFVLERYRDEVGDWQVALHSPFGAQVHAAWALAINHRLQQNIGVDFQVLHSDDGIVMRLPDTDDDEIFELVREAVLCDPDTVTATLTAALGGSALFASRFRECAARALLLPRWDPGRRAPLWQQRQRGAQLLATASDYPTFPIVLETVRECLQDVYDVPSLQQILTRLHTGEIELREVVTDHPSPFASQLIFGYVAAFMYEGDVPLAERRAQALTLDPTLLAELLGTEEMRSLLDPQALEDVTAELGWLTPERRLRGEEDLADALRMLGPLSLDDIVERGGTLEWAERLVTAKRAFVAPMRGGVYVAVEDAARVRDALGVNLPQGIPSAFTEPVADPMGDLLRRYARSHGPFTTAEVAAEFGLGVAVAASALSAQRDAGVLLSGEFRPDGSGPEWIDPDVLRRIRRRSMAALRQQSEPVEPDVLARFLPHWHGLDAPRRGVDGVYMALEQLAGCPIPASALESMILPSRVADYRPQMLDELTTSGEIVWCGAGQLPSGDGWLTFAPADAPYLLTPAADEVSDPANGAITSMLSDGGGWFINAIIDRLSTELPEGFDPSAVPDLLRDLLWSGHITNDSIAVVRQGLTRQRTTSRVQRPRRRPRAPIVGLPPRSPRKDLALGRWSIVPSMPLEHTARAAAVAPWLLARHGVVVRGSMAVERFPGGFAHAYRVFSALEDAGSCVRAYVVDGRGAAQFAQARTIDLVRTFVSAESPAIVLAATDPAQPFGAALPWPDRPDSGHRPGRKAGASVVLVNGSPVLFVERGGRSLLTFPSSTAAMTEATQALAAAVQAGRLPSLKVRRCDGEDIATSSISAALQQAGFHLSPSGLRLRAG
jgi:ATP-dependent helicase Lhr and Lhr-like helicase